MKLFFEVCASFNVPKGTITPHGAKRWKRSISELYEYARAEIEKARADKAAFQGDASIIYRENLEGYLWSVNLCRTQIRKIREALDTVVVERYSNLSPTAARREARRRGSK